MAEAGAGNSSVQPIATTVDTTEMLAREREAVAVLRGKKVDDKVWLGLALSGGGIRSASFAMGVMQAFDGASVMQRFDYLSTVSGGGYIGSSLSYFLHEHAKHAKEPAGPIKFWFPFGRRGQTGARGDRVFVGPDTQQSEGLLQDSLAVQIVSFIRQQAHYLTPTPKLGDLTSITNALRAACFSFSIYFAMVVLVLGMTFDMGRPEGWLGASLWSHTSTTGGSRTAIYDLFAWLELHQPALKTILAMPYGPAAINTYAFIELIALALFFTGILIFSFSSYFVVASRYTKAEVQEGVRFFYPSISVSMSTWLRGLLQLQIACVVLGSLPWTYVYVASIPTGLFGLAGLAVAFVSVWSGTFGIVLSWLSKSRPGKELWPYLLAAVLTYLLLYYAFVVAQELDKIDSDERWLPYIVLSVGILLGGWLVNLNLVSRSRMSRDRLMEALCPNFGAVRKGKWAPASSADALQLSQLPGGVTSKLKGRIKAPYHLINTAVIIPGSKQPKYSSRGADSFVLSANWCGSDATSWAPTHVYMNDRMVLPTAMAISGAAVNARSGANGNARLGSPAIAFLVTLFGAQFVYWAPNPRGINDPSVSFGQTTPNYLRPGIRGLLGWHMNEHAGFVQLSDGAHFENLGLYELIRRKLRLIVVSDGGQDAEYMFEDLGNVIERVRVDFGVGIYFTAERLSLEGLLPTPHDATSTSWSSRFGLAQRGFAAAWIDYPDQDERGILLYIKATMVADLPSDLYAYKAQNPEFPDRSTINRNFDEGQFEAYRELGYRLTKGMIERIRDKPTLEDTPEAILVANARRFLGLDSANAE